MMFARLFVVTEGVVAFVMFSGVSFILQGCDQADQRALPEALEKTSLGQYCAAANLAYEQFYSKIVFAGERRKLEDNGWTHAESYTHNDLLGTDSAHLWKKSGDCILAFRGSDNPTDFINDFETSDETYYGIDGINSGIVREFEGLLHQMMSPGKQLLKDVVEESCKNSFVVVGHSLGGALGQLFAAIVNHRDDPLSWPRKVDALYLFGSTPVARTRLRNDQSADGCFSGKSYYNVKQMSLLGQYTDFAYDFPPGAGFKHAHIPLVTVEGDDHTEISCKSTMEYNLLKTSATLHFYMFD